MPKTLNLAELSTLVRLTFSEEIDMNNILAVLNSNENIVYAEPNYIYRIDDILPGDSKFSKQWGLHNTGQTGGSKDADIDAPEAWEIQKGNKNVIVAIVDTGIDTNHPDLKKNIWTNNGEIKNNGIDDDGNGYIDDINGWDFVNEENKPMDDHGHGTHVAGIVGAVSDNNIGITGISWNGRLMALKAIGKSGQGDVKAVEAIYYGTNNGVRIFNNSWGGDFFSQTLQDAINHANSLGALFIASAGNNSDDDPSFFPANFENSFAVASTDHNDHKSGFSNFGDWVDISAPGSSIFSTWRSNQYGLVSGTSMSAPHVSGVAALLFAEHPDWTPLDVQAQIENTADDLDQKNPSFAGKLGAGRINAHAALLPTLDDMVFRVERSSGNVFTKNTFISSGADMAERINVSEKVESGDVVELDPNKPGYYRKARGNSQLIAGIITTSPGFTLGNRRDYMGTTKDLTIESKPMLALMGRVPVKATTENGSIFPGNLLMMSNKPGYAQRCVEVKACEGVIIGKAIEGLARGEGLILILVMTR